MRARMSQILVGLMLAALMGVGCAFAAASLEGIVVDENGKAVSQVSVLVTHDTRVKLKREATTDEAGIFTLAVGEVENPYRIVLSKNGFAGFEGIVEFVEEKTVKIEFTILSEAAASGTDATGHYNAGVRAGREERWKEAIASYELALALDGTLTKATYALAQAHYELKEFDEAQTYAEAYLKHDGADESSWQILLESSLARGDEKASERACVALRGSELGEAYAADFNNKGVEATNAGDYAAADRNYRLALAFDPANAVAVTNLATVVFARGRIGEALGLADQILELSPGDANAQEIKYLGLAMLDNPEGSRAQLEALLAGQGFERAEYTALKLARILEGQGEELAATQGLGRAVEILQDSGKVHLRYGLLLIRQGRLKTAREHLARGLELAPKAPDAELARELVDQLGD